MPAKVLFECSMVKLCTLCSVLVLATIFKLDK